MPTGNPDIATYGKNTRFGSEAGADPAAAARIGNVNRASVRESIRAQANIGMESWKGLTEEDLMDQLLVSKKPTAAQLNAARQHAKAILGNSQRSSEHVAEQIDGKLIQATFNADYDRIANLTPEQKIAYLAELDAFLGTRPEADDQDGAGEGEAGTGTGNADQVATGDGSSADEAGAVHEAGLPNG